MGTFLLIIILFRCAKLKYWSQSYIPSRNVFYICFVKSIILTLNIYIMALSMLPCVDKDDLSGSGHKIIISVQDSPDNTHRGLEMCSPFCNCSCCSVFRIISDNTSTYKFHDITPAEDIFTLYTDSFPKGISSAIWQPPQIT